MVILLFPDQSYLAEKQAYQIFNGILYVLILALASFSNLNFKITSNIRKMNPTSVRPLSYFEAIFQCKTLQLLDLYHLPLGALDANSKLHRKKARKPFCLLSCSFCSIYGLTNDIKLDDTQLFFPLFFLFVSLLCGFLLCLCPR